MYLTAIAKFRNRFYVIKEDRATCAGQSVKVAGRSYGYYITSDAQKAPVSFEPEEGHTVTPLNPFVPIGECSCGELVAMCQTLALMYLPMTKSLDTVMGRRADPDNPVARLAEGGDDSKYAGVAVIDFIYALESDAEDPPPGEKSGLELLFNGDGANAPPLRRGRVEEDDEPQLVMYLLIADSPENELADVPQIGFNANAGQREPAGGGQGGGNQGEFMPMEAVTGPAVQAADEMVINLASTFGGVSKPLAMVCADQGVNDNGISIWGIREKYGGKVIDLNGTIPANFFMAQGAPLFGDNEQFIPPAELTAEGLDTIPVWYRVSGAENSFNSQSGEFSITAMVPPSENCWTSKYDFGISVNAADIGRDNESASWLATSANMGNSYGFDNRDIMQGYLYKKLRNAAVADKTVAQSRSISYVSTTRFETFRQGESSNADEAEIELPTIAEGLEGIQISINGSQTEVSLTVGNTQQRQASKAMFERMVQSPGTLYRPGGLMPNSFMQGTTPRFQNFMKGR